MSGEIWPPDLEWYEIERRTMAHTQARYKERTVLMALLMSMDRRSIAKGGTRISRPGIDRLIEMSGFDRARVKEALRQLRLTGEICAVRYIEGGRGRSTEYGFPIALRGTEIDPVGKNEKGGDNLTKGGRLLDKRGAKSDPPINDTDSNRRAGAPERRGPGRATQGHKVPSGEGARQWRGWQAEKKGAGGDRYALPPGEAQAVVKLTKEELYKYCRQLDSEGRAWHAHDAYRIWSKVHQDG